MRSLDASASRWSPPSQISIQSGPLEGATPGPPGGVSFMVPGQASPRMAVAFGSRSLGGGAALLSDDHGPTWRASGLANPRGGEAQLAVAPNGSLLLNSRGDRQGVRWQSESRDFGETWSAPRVLDFGFGSSCEGSILRVPNSSDLLFSHAGRVHDRWNRWNLTIWRSRDSGANWTAVVQVEKVSASELEQLHTAYSSLVALAAATTAGGAATGIGLAYERGPMPGSHITPSKCGIRDHPMEAIRHFVLSSLMPYSHVRVCAPRSDLLLTYCSFRLGGAVAVCVCRASPRDFSYLPKLRAGVKRSQKLS